MSESSLHLSHEYSQVTVGFRSLQGLTGGKCHEIDQKSEKRQGNTLMGKTVSCSLHICDCASVQWHHLHMFVILLNVKWVTTPRVGVLQSVCAYRQCQYRSRSWFWTTPVQHRFGLVSEHFLDRTRSMRSICSVVFYISYKPHFTSATKKESN